MLKWWTLEFFFIKSKFGYNQKIDMVKLVVNVLAGVGKNVRRDYLEASKQLEIDIERMTSEGFSKEDIFMVNSLGGISYDIFR